MMDLGNMRSNGVRSLTVRCFALPLRDNASQRIRAMALGFSLFEK
jgi:hypothetical protein